MRFHKTPIQNEKEQNMLTNNSDNELNRQVADKTGEDLATIQRLGFGPLTTIEMEERDTPLVVDWDLLAASR